MSTARRRLKSPKSLYGTSTHPTMVTHRLQSWSCMIDSQPFLSMSISASTPIPQIRLFQTLTFKLQGQGHGCGQRIISNKIPLKSNQVITMTRGIQIQSSDWLSGSHYILQTSNYLSINVTAVTLGQGHPKVTQYIFPDPYFLCPKYLRSSLNGFDVRSKSHCGGGGDGGGGGRGRGGGNELKTECHPRLGWLN